MAEYIEREALLANLKRQYGEDLGWQCTVNMSDVGMMIEDAPAADVVEVVRCKDCKHLRRAIYRRDLSCDYWDCESATEYVAVRDNDFCSNGERREK